MTDRYFEDFKKGVEPYTLDFVALPIPPMPVPTEGWRVAVQGQ